jgi:CMP-N-acetylneuraminic acid synthetase
VIGVVEAKGITWAMRMGKNDQLRPLDARALTRRRQDLPRLFLPNGALYVLSTGRVERPWFSGAVGFVMPRKRSVDIDDALDLRIARVLASRR